MIPKIKKRKMRPLIEIFQLIAYFISYLLVMVFMVIATPFIWFYRLLFIEKKNPYKHMSYNEMDKLSDKKLKILASKSELFND